MINLNNIAIQGVGNTPLDKAESLLPLEPLLQMMGYKSDENWNSEYFSMYKYSEETYIFIYDDKHYEYHSHDCGASEIITATDFMEQLESTSH